ncbi:flagellar MS-ring protein [Caulifigura coniformis]|uniref:Flagellar MS-ring protein n=1 Tax=Caulifigura coniformis TaxID=2527983 RepID=A0A517S887_9PLAN|nr:hypothetical protein [Caulifigura coniformis]QDT52322.1 flagellar MS-ring protein [Caulifigura coniformis]
MDDSIDTTSSIADRFRALPETQRRLLPVVVVAIVLAAGWLLSQRSGATAVLPLPHGLTPAAAVAHLAERGVPDAKTSGPGKITVPAARTADARRFLDELSAVSTSWADEWEKSNSQLGQFSGHRERDAAREIARARMIGRLLRQMPGIAQADVVWDEEDSAGWRAPQKTRCTVYLRPQTGYEITADVARSVRQAVAGSKKHLAAEDIVVMDLDRMTTFDAVPSGIDETTRSLAEREVIELRQEVETALRDCAGVRVNVSVNWLDHRAEDTEVELLSVSRRETARRPIQLASSNGFLEELSRDEEVPGPFEPSIQITVTAPEDAAAEWALQHSPNAAHDPEVKPASFQRPLKAKAADTIRQSVCSVLSKFDRRNLAKGVSVHLTAATGVAETLETVPDERVIDPLWFLAIAIIGCAAGAWVLSSAFASDDRSPMAHAGHHFDEPAAPV